jgi:WXG100 family type VII secretion target
MPADGLIQYQYSVLQQGVQTMQNLNNQIMQQTQELQAQTKQLMGDWTGTTATEYDACSQRIGQELSESSNILNQTAIAVNTGATTMGDRDRQLSNMFGG